jgi:Protein of unknown function (DUF2793)
MSETTNLSLPFLAASQAQKHVTHNEALIKLDALVQLSAMSRMLAGPPSDPEEGARYLVAAPAADGWQDHDGDIAAFQDGVWNFFTPKPGWRLWLADEAMLVIFDGSAWLGLTGDVTSTSMLGVSATADMTNRLAVSSPASLFDHAGAGHQLKLNKSAPSQTASLLFQTEYSGRAEAGLAGDDRFRLKVSPDGSSWFDALEVDNATGVVGFPHGTAPGSAHILGRMIAASPGADSHNFDPDGWNGDHPDRAAHIRLLPSATMRLTGLAGGETARLALITNATAGEAAGACLVILEHDSASSLSVNRFRFADRMPRLLMPGETIALIYDWDRSAWLECVPSRFASVFETYSDAYNSNDFPIQSSGTSASGQSGAYLLGDPVQKPRGVCQLDTGATATGRAYWGSPDNAFLPGQGAALYLARLAIETLSTSAQRFHIRAGWHDSHNSTDVTDGVYWEYDDGVSADWSLCVAAAGVRNKVQSGILAGVNYVYLGIFLNGDWSRADFFSSSDGCAWTVHEPLNAGLPTASQALGFSAGIGKTIGASQRNLSIDIQAIRYDALRGG